MEFLIKARRTSSAPGKGFNDGDIILAKPDGHTWGSRELPNVIRISNTDLEARAIAVGKTFRQYVHELVNPELETDPVKLGTPGENNIFSADGEPKKGVPRRRYKLKIARLPVERDKPDTREGNDLEDTANQVRIR